MAQFALADEPRRVNQTAVTPLALNKVAPDMPPLARQLKLAGTVEVDLTIDESGSVTKVEGVRGNPILLKAAETAAAKWKFKPYMDGDKAIPVVSTISFAFKM